LKPDSLSHPAFNAVSDHGFAECFGRGETSLRAITRRGRAKPEGSEEWARIARTLVVYLAEIARSQQPDTFWKAWYPGYLSELTDSFLRPMARRRERTAWPSEVFMRARNPCVFARRRLFG